MSMPQQAHTTSRITWTNASTRSVDVSGTKFVYRATRCGRQCAGDLARRLPNAELVLYDDAGHGGIFQYHEAFVKNALEFLES
jgi:pimeloyl-ACP methyl ester carboxylesterase